MDYSAASAESDVLTGASPWGSSSPRGDRSGFTQSDVPSSPPVSDPTTNDLGHTHSNSQDSISANPFASEPRAGPISAQADESRQLFGDEQEDKSTRQEPVRSQYQQHQQQQQQQQQQQYQQHQQNQQQQQQQQNQHQHHHHPHQTRPQRPVPAYKLQAKVTALERTGRKDPVIRFDVYTNLPKFRTTQFRDVRRTHSEFVKLADHLISSNPEALVPAVPPALTSAGAGTDEDETRVKTSIQRWLNNVCGNEVLMRDEEMIFFVESDFGYSPVVRIKQPATGVRRKMLKQFAPPPDDTPELHDARPVVKLFYLGTLDAQQKLERVVKARRSLALAETALGTSVAQMHVQEPHPGLSNAYRKLGRIIQTIGDYHAAQGTAEATTLGDPLTYHAADAFIVKETLTNRHILLRELLQAEQALRSKEVAFARLKSSTSVRQEKVDEAISAVEEARSSESYLRSKTQRVTANLLQEKRRWFDRTSADFLSSVREFALRQIESERRALATLESVRMDIRAIDSSGGLSRLGREHKPSGRRTSLASSQTAKGDSWSGVPRSRDTAASRTVSYAVLGGVTEAADENLHHHHHHHHNSANGDGPLSSSSAGLGATAAGAGAARPRSATGTASVSSLKDDLVDDDADRVDARNAASRLAQSTF